MQTSLINCMASNCAESSVEAVSSGHGFRIDSAIQTQTNDSLFTSILQQGIAISGPNALGLGSNDNPLILSTDDAMKMGQDESIDVCSLLMQLMMMNSANQSEGNNDGNNKSPEKTANGLLGVINEISAEIPSMTPDTVLKGPENAASVILQNDGKAAEVLSAFAALKGTDLRDGQTNGEATALSADDARTRITEALNSALDSTAQNAQLTTVEAVNTEIADGVPPYTHAVVNKDSTETAGQPEAASAASATLADLAVEKTITGKTNANGNNTDSDTAEHNFGEIISRDKRRNDGVGTAGSQIDQILNGTDINSEAMAEKTAAVERALARFTDDLRSIRSGNQEIRIVLEPESLGVLIISVVRTESGISAKIKSEDKEVTAIISEHLQKLITSMQSKGLTVNDVDVIHSLSEQNMSFAQHNFSQARDESSKGNTVPADKNPDADTSNNEVWQNYFGGDTSGDTTVDYRI